MEDLYLEYEKQINLRYSEPKIDEIKGRHKTYIENIIKNQGSMYSDLIEKRFFSGSHETIQIMELKDCVDYLKHGLDIEIIEEKCKENPVLQELRTSLICSILSVTANTERNYLYGPTIRVLMKITDFYEIFIRSIKKIPPYYHTYRYERYVEHCISLKGLFIVPTFANIGATDLLRLRPFPLFPVGLNIKLEFVDEYYQGPKEFFIHDINHSRRMYESNISDMKKNNVDETDQSQVTEYYKQSYDCLTKLMKILDNKINEDDINQFNQYSVSKITIPTISIKGKVTNKEIYHLEMYDYSDVSTNTPIDFGYSQLIKIIIFEITHEDSLPMRKDVICSTILRTAGIDTGFDNYDSKVKITNSSEKGGSILGFVKYKLRNGFFDSINKPLSAVVTHFYRTDKQIAIATQILLAILCDNRVANNSDGYEQIIINITNKEGLNVPTNKDLVAGIIPHILLHEKYGDFTEDDVNKLRTKHNINTENLYTGNRPKPITEQNDVLKKLGGKKTKRRLVLRNKTKKKVKSF